MRKVFAALAIAIVLTGCTSPEPPPEKRTTAHLYFVSDTASGIRLFREAHRIPKSDDPALAALRDLVGKKPLDPDYENLWPASTEIRSVEVSAGVAIVDMAKPTLNVGAEAEMMAIQQLLWTLSSADPSVSALRITVDGSPIESLAGHVDAMQPFVKPPPYEALAIVWLLRPAEGASVSGAGFTLSGMACTFEANVVWTIRQGTRTVRSGSTTAAIACPEWSPWSVRITGLAPGEYVAEAADYSAKDGSLLVRDTKTFVVE